jgi:hypothetical protein
MFGDYIDRIYPDEGDIKNTTLLLGLFVPIRMPTVC